MEDPITNFDGAMSAVLPSENREKNFLAEETASKSHRKSFGDPSIATAPGFGAPAFLLHLACWFGYEIGPQC